MTSRADSIVVSVISLTAQGERDKNLAKAETFIRQSVAKGAQWVSLPEVFHYHGPYDTLHHHADERGGDLHKRFASLSKELKIVLFCGSFGERCSVQKNETRVRNVSYVFGPQGEELGRYEKTHLFNLNDASGQKVYKESDGYLPGSEIKTIDVQGLRVGLSICYDLRHPELYIAMQRQGPLDVLFVPSAFTYITGKAHWEILLKARAIENQCYVVAANQVGVHSPGKKSYGHSMIIDPWGEKLANTFDEEGFALATISKSRISEVRAKLPSLGNKRPEIYK
jgi:nitrilase